MNAIFRRTVLLLTVLSLAFALGCAKKEVESMPPGATGQKTATSAEQLEKDKAAMEEKYRQQELEEERRRQEMEQMKAQEAAAFEEAAAQIATMIHFDFDSYELDTEAREILQAKMRYLKDFPEVKLVIEGYCDDRGTEEYNLALGERRARAAYEFLVLLGISPDRMTIVSFGEEDPIDPAQNEVAWAKNRRAQFRIVE